MINGVSSVWVPVEDMDRATAFYRDTLGLEITEHDGGWAEVDANGVKIGLNAGEKEGAGADGGPVIAFEPSDGIDATVAELRSRGVEFPAEISDHPWGRVATFVDSEGNDLQIYEPPQG